MLKIQHFIITRFNLKVSESFTTDKNQMSTQDIEWLSHRFDLFEKYCLPSISAQTNKDFSWIILFDIDTPEVFRKRIEQAKSVCPQIVDIYLAGSNMMPELEKHIKDDTDVLITTRMDNDDAFRDDALQVIRQQLDGLTEDLCINMRFGYSYDVATDQAEVFSQKYNPFSSLIEFRKNTPFKTIWGAAHGKIHQLAKVRQLKSGPHWLMVVHERNVANRMPGEYKNYSLWKWRRLKRYVKKYFIPRIRKLFWSAEFKKKYSLQELRLRFHSRL
ncbi:MAG TPA: glycosyltransferase [Gammaproteobacteria bacterium]